MKKNQKTERRKPKKNKINSVEIIFQTRWDPNLPFVVVSYFVVAGIYIKHDRYDQSCGPILLLVL